MADSSLLSLDVPGLENTISITINYKAQRHTYQFSASSTLAELSTRIATDLSLPEANQKFLISPRPGLLKPPFTPDSPNGAFPLANAASRKITLLGSTPTELTALDTAIATFQKQANRTTYTGPAKPAKPARRTDWKSLQDATTYTFMDIKPLPYLPSPEKSLRYLQRLANDPGIKATMAKHKWSVGLLTEMNPAEHTTHESKTLGLNRNAGEVIELRLRTDAYDGYRDYKTIRRTLCHELTHNVFGDHDRKFWDLCKQVEKEVEVGDWKSGGRTVGNDEFYNPHDQGVGEAEVHDHGAWSGQSYVLGGASAAGAAGDRREVMARAAEERAKRQQEGGAGGGPSSGT